SFRRPFPAFALPSCPDRRRVVGASPCELRQRPGPLFRPRRSQWTLSPRRSPVRRAHLCPSPPTSLPPPTRSRLQVTCTPSSTPAPLCARVGGHPTLPSPVGLERGRG